MVNAMRQGGTLDLTVQSLHLPNQLKPLISPAAHPRTCVLQGVLLQGLSRVMKLDTQSRMDRATAGVRPGC